MIDSHCHLDDPRFDGDRDAVVARARAAGVARGVVPGVRASTWARAQALAHTYGWGYALGTHPWYAAAEPALPDDLGGAVAIGECGLDGRTGGPLAAQEPVLEAHLALAREAGLPVILHCYRAHDRMLAILRRHAPVRGVMHAYSGGADRVDAYVALGLHLSFAGAITWGEDTRPVRALLRVPADRLLVETDAPDQCPRPHHGRSEPAYVVDILAAMERLRREPLRERILDTTHALGW